MMKGFFRAALLAVMCLPGLASALGMGEIEAHSYLNQPLEARIPLKSYDADDIKNLKVTMASEVEFARAGVEYAPVLKNVRFKVVLDPKTRKYYIRVYTTAPVSNAYLNFLVEVNWPQGRLIREYTLLLDPPDMTSSTAPGIDIVEVEQETEEPQQQQPTRAPVVSSGTQPIVYGPVRINETLWEIAERIRGDRRDITIEQVMMTLLRSNPNAFINNNVNNLKAGVILRIENPDDLKSMSRSQAEREFRRQYQAWLDYKRRRAASPQPQKQQTRTQTATGSDTTSQQAGTDGGTLKLRPPEGDEKQLGQSEQTATDQATQKRISQLQGQLDSALEDAESGRQENAVLRERLKALEEQLAALQRVVTVKSDELASLQEQLQSQKQDLEEGMAAEATGQEEPAEKVESEPEVEVEAETVTQAEEPQASSEEVVKKPGEPGFFDMLAKGVQSWYQNPMQVGITGGLFVLLLVLILLYIRQRKARENIIYSNNLEQNARYQDDYFDEEHLDNWGAEQGFEPEVEGGLPEDPMAQADIFIAFGKFDEAVELMQQAIEADPDNLALKVKLDDILNLKSAKPRLVTTEEMKEAAAEAEEDFEAAMTPLPEEELAAAPEPEMPAAEPESWAEPEPEPFAEMSEHDVEIVPIEDGQSDEDMNFPNYGSDYTKPYEGGLISEDEISSFHRELGGEPTPSGLGVVEEGLQLEPASSETGEVGESGDIEFNVDDLSFASEETAETKEPADTSTALDFDLGDLEGLEGLEEQLAEMGEEEAQTESTLEFDTAGLDELMAESLEPESADESTSSLDWPGEGELSAGADDFSDEEIADLQSMVAEDHEVELEAQPEIESVDELDLEAELSSALDELESELTSPAIDLSSDEDVDLLNTVDEVGTKLDLAKAYMDMGDPDGARSILEEVQQEGNEQQKQEANELLEQLVEMA